MAPNDGMLPNLSLLFTVLFTTNFVKKIMLKIYVTNHIYLFLFFYINLLYIHLYKKVKKVIISNCNVLYIEIIVLYNSQAMVDFYQVKRLIKLLPS